MLARAARFSLFLIGIGPLSSCGIYGDSVTIIALNHSDKTVVVTAAKGQNAGKSFRMAPTKGLMVGYGSFGDYVTIQTEPPNSEVLFSGHLCPGDWVLNGNDEVLVVTKNLKVSCVRQKDLDAGHTGI